MLYALGILVFLGLAYSIFIEPRRPRLGRVEIPIAALDPALEGFTILHLSDLHQGRFGARQRRLLALIGRGSYDMAVITGDFLSSYSPYDFAPTAELLAGLKKPVYGVFGNHDYLEKDRLAKDLSRHGVVVLENEWRPVGGVLQIAGVADPSFTARHPEAPVKTDLGRALAGADPKLFTLLLAHSPGILSAAAQASIPLVLCGHTHGGQVKIPLLGAPTTASGRLFDPYVQGPYREGETCLYINRGLGTSGLPLRFLSPPEVAFITLRSV